MIRDKIYIVPDHGELLGQNGRYGHNAVDLDMAKVPFLFYGPGLKEGEVERLKSELGCLSNHYLISLQVASLLGYNISNPNEVPGQYYLNGTDVFGEAGYMKYDIGETRGAVCSQI